MAYLHSKLCQTYMVSDKQDNLLTKLYKNIYLKYFLAYHCEVKFTVQKYTVANHHFYKVSTRKKKKKKKKVKKYKNLQNINRQSFQSKAKKKYV